MSVNVVLLGPQDFLESKDRLDMLEGPVLMALLAKVKENLSHFIILLI